MKKYFIKNIITFSLFSFLLIVFQTCGDDVAGSDTTNNSVGGTVSYIDSGFYFNSAYYYAVTIYPDSANPYTHTPVASDSVDINLQNKTAYYKVSGLAPGHYYVASTYIRYSTRAIVAVLGAYGCDTDPNCSNLTVVTVPNAAGNGADNFRSKTH